MFSDGVLLLLGSSGGSSGHDPLQNLLVPDMTEQDAFPPSGILGERSGL